MGKRVLRVTFLLPLAGTEPIGGFKVVYEYANYLARQGHAVSVVHPARLRIDEPLSKMPVKQAAKTVLEYVRKRVTGEFKPAAWFRVEPAVRLLWAPSLAARYVPDGDVVVASSWETAEWAATYPAAKGRKFYLIQHHETWSGPEERVMATWRMPLEKIVIARWLEEIAESVGQTAHLVDNGLDFSRFRMLKAIEERDPKRVLMMFHNQPWKGSPDGLRAFALAKAEEPGLQLTLFGLAGRPEDLAEEIAYYQNPPQEVIRDLYNEATIFVSPSWAEGFPLPPAEAMQCGAALMCTDIGGTAMYAIDGETALLSPVQDSEAMAANLLRLVREPELRVRIARAGNEFIQRFTWERAGARFEEILLSADEKG
jgi:glycosyltransferase involved in cell wall biosynthesis